MTFPEFVAIKQKEVPEASMDYKAMSSFSGAIRAYGGDLPTEDHLKIWLASMIDRGVSASTRKRYVEKLGTINKDFATRYPDVASAVDPFEAVRSLRDVETTAGSAEIRSNCSRLSVLFNIVMQDAARRPEIAVFLYLLLNASADVEKAIALRTDEYLPVFPQLEDIIDTSAFHHRRKYVFDLSQSRKRMPQLVRETVTAIAEYLAVKEIRFHSGFSPRSIVALWTAKARESGISLSDIRSTLEGIPSEFEYLKYIDRTELPLYRRLAIKKKVAEAFSPTDFRWYAMKLRRVASFESVKARINSEFPVDFYYPTREVKKKVGKKMVKEMIPFIPDIIFIRTKQIHAVNIDRSVRRENLGWLFRQTNNSDSDYSVIDWRAMHIFQRAVGEFSRDIRIELTQDQPTEIGRKVRITGGIFAGYTGRIYDIKGDDDVRSIYIKLSEEYGIRVEMKIDSCLVAPIPEP